MKLFSLSGSHALKVAAFVALIGTPTAVLLPGCGGGSDGGFGGGGTTNPTQLQQFTGNVSLNATQTGTLLLKTYSDDSAKGTFTISNAVATQVKAAAAAATFTPGTYAVSGSLNGNHALVTGKISGDTFSVDMTLPTSSTAGSFVVTIGGQTYTGTIPVATATATATATGTPTATRTGTPTATSTGTPTPTATTSAGQVPLGNGPLTINLTSSNSSLSAGNITTSTGATAVVDQVGGSNRMNLVTGSNSLPVKAFNLLVTKSSRFVAGDSITIRGEAGNADIITLLVTNLSNPANSGSFRGQSGTFKITSVAGKKVSFSVTNLKMVSEVNGSSFNLNGSGSFTIN